AGLTGRELRGLRRPGDPTLRLSTDEALQERGELAGSEVKQLRTLGCDRKSRHLLVDRAHLSLERPELLRIHRLRGCGDVLIRYAIDHFDLGCAPNQQSLWRRVFVVNRQSDTISWPF